MAFVEWQSTMSVGVLAIDQQHTHLLEIMSNLHEVMARGGKPAEVSTVLEEVISYARQHFAYEEQLLERSGFPDLEDHKKKHKAMFTEVELYLERSKQGSTTVSFQLMTFLKGWVVKHIMQTDKAYSAHLAKAPSGMGMLISRR